MRRRSMEWVCVVAGAVCLAAGAQAAPIEVGSGVNQAELWIEFGDGALYDFTVSFGLVEGDTTTGLGLFDIIEAETSLTTDRLDYGDIFIDGITYEGHSDVGWAGGEDYWHYWNAESDAPQWAFGSTACSARIISDGDADGWVYGHVEAPAPEPTSLMLLGFGAVAALRRRR